jgi:hypothetical protein
MAAIDPLSRDQTRLHPTLPRRDLGHYSHTPARHPELVEGSDSSCLSGKV